MRLCLLNIALVLLSRGAASLLRELGRAVLRVDLRAVLVKTLWKNPAGVPYSSLDDAYRQTGGGLLALTNAGIYSERHAPEGLHVEGGVTLSPLNLSGGEGNFYWRPNGVFYVGEGGAGIAESEKFNSAAVRAGVREATQSGPLLVIDGEVNQSLKPDSRSLYVRNGIGVKSPEEVYIVTSEGEVSLYDFDDGTRAAAPSGEGHEHRHTGLSF